MSRRRGFTELSPEQFQRTLGPKLQKVVDRARDLFTKFGLRPYVVKLVRLQWTSGTRNDGDKVVLSQTPILPTPRIQDLSTLRDVLEQVGRFEAGELRVSEISGRYSEYFLRGYDEDGNPPSQDISFFWVVEFPSQTPSRIDRRWFEVTTAPGFNSERFEWTLTLMRAEFSGCDEVL